MSDFLPFIVIGLVSGSVYGLAGVGLVLTYRTSGIFNFAHGVVGAIAAFVFFQLWTRNGLPWPLALLLSVLVLGPLMGLFLEVLCRTLTNAPIVARVVATLGILVGVQQLLIIVFGEISLTLPPFLPTSTVTISGVAVSIDQMIGMVVALLGTVGLSLLLRLTRLGRRMRAVVDNTDLLALTGSSPKAVRRASWCIGATFGALSGILLAPTIGLDAFVLTLLVVSAFGAAAVGMFRSLPLTYVGGLLIGVAGSLSTKYTADVPLLAGLPPSLPFVVLFGVLVLAPRHALVEVALERSRPATDRAQLSGVARKITIAVPLILLAVVPHVVGTQLVVYITGLAYVLVFLSLVVLERFSGQLSLCQLSFVAVGGVAFWRLTNASVPWLFSVLIAALLVVPVGALLAIPAIRRSGLYLALATLGFGLVMVNLIYGSPLMFGGSGGLSSVPTPRPSFAEGDISYYYVVLLVVLAASGLVMWVRRSRMGRLLRAMADSQVALTTHGMNVNFVKVSAFCISAFLAGLGGAVLGPVTGQLSAEVFGVFPSLLLVVVLALQQPLPDIPAAFAAAAALMVVPAYIDSQVLTDWLPVLFGVAAVGVAMAQGQGGAAGGSVSQHAESRERHRLTFGPVKQRMVEARLWPVPGGEL